MYCFRTEPCGLNRVTCFESSGSSVKLPAKQQLHTPSDFPQQWDTGGTNGRRRCLESLQRHPQDSELSLNIFRVVCYDLIVLKIMFMFCYNRKATDFLNFSFNLNYTLGNSSSSSPELAEGIVCLTEKPLKGHFKNNSWKSVQFGGNKGRLPVLPFLLFFKSKDVTFLLSLSKTGQCKEAAGGPLTRANVMTFNH